MREQFCDHSFRNATDTEGPEGEDDPCLIIGRVNGDRSVKATAFGLTAIPEKLFVALAGVCASGFPTSLPNLAIY